LVDNLFSKEILIILYKWVFMSNLQEIIARNPGLQGKESVSLLNLARHPEKTTEKYKASNDIAVVQTLNEAGWSLTNYKQVKGHKVEDRIFKPYLATFENSLLPELQGEGKFQILKRNAKDGTKADELLVGFFRFACENGLVVGTNLIQPLRVKHIGNQPVKLEEAVTVLADKAPQLYSRIKEMMQFTLTQEQKEEFASAAIISRMGEENKGAMNVTQILQPRRLADAGDSLWRVFNVVQENIIKAPVGIELVNTEGKTRKARAITNIDQNLRINRELWNNAELFMQ